MIRKLLIGLISLLLLLIFLLYLLIATQLGLRLSVAIAKHFIPGKLTVHKISGQLAGPLSIKGLSYQSNSLTVQLGRLKLDWAPVALFSHRLDIKSLSIHSLHIKQISSTSTPSKTTSSEPFKLPLQFNLNNIQLNDVSFQQGNDAPTVIQSATIKAYSLFHRINVAELTVSSAPYQLQLHGSSHVSKPYASQLQGSLTDNALLNEPVTLKFSLDGDLNLAKLKASVSKPFSATLTAKLSQPLQHGPIDINGAWQNLNWPLSKTDSINSPKGKLSVTGTLKDYRVELNTSLSSKQIPNTELNLNAQGNWKSIKLNSLTAKLLGGNLVATGQFNWEPSLSWHANLTAHKLNPAIQWRAHKGQINFDLTSKGNLSNQHPLISADLSSLSGTLDNQALSGSASIQKTNSDWHINSLKLNAGDNHLTAQGLLGEHSNFSWHASLNNLSLFLEDDAGDIKTQGKLTGNLSHPNIKAAATLLNLSYNDLTAKHIQLNALVNLSGHSTVKLSGQTIKLGQHNIHSLLLSAHGTKAKHQLHFSADSSLGKLILSLNGSYQGSTWLATLGKLNFNSKHFGNWTLNQPVKIVYGEDKSLSPFCWRSQHGGLCLQAQQFHNGSAKLKASLHHFNIGMLQGFMPEGITARSNIGAAIDLKRTHHGKVEGTALVNIHQANLTIQVKDKQQRITFINSTVAAKFDKNGLQASLKLRDKNNWMPTTAMLSLPGYHGNGPLTSKQTLQAKLTANWLNLGFLAPLIPGVNKLSGKLLTQLSVKGSLGNPHLYGSLKLSNAQLLLDKLGLTLSAINFNLSANGTDQLAISAALNSNGHPLTIKGTTTIAKNFAPSEITVKGTNVPVISNSEYKVNLSPDLKIVYKAPLLKITGTVDIPYARITPRDFTSTVELPSSVVFVNEEDSGPPLIQPTAKITVSIGEDNSIEYAGLKASLGGEVTVNYSPQGVSTATGTLNVRKGGYEAYGQKLKIDSGSLIYTGGPIDNPGINVVASKVIHVDKLGTANLFDNNNITVGVRASGRLDNPKISLFSNPSMSATNKLSYLVFGQSSDNVSGSSLQLLSQAAGVLGVTGGDKSLVGKIQSSLGLDEFGIQSSQVINPEGGEAENNTSFVVGKKLSPRLFISYSLGMIVPVNVFKARYQVFKHWAVQTDASQLGSGGDILWTYETN